MSRKASATAKNIDTLKSEVSAAIKIRDCSRRHPFDGLLTGDAGLFEILRDQFGWVEADYRNFYPEQTIKYAIHQGWKF